MKMCIIHVNLDEHGVGLLLLDLKKVEQDIGGATCLKSRPYAQLKEKSIWYSEGGL